MVSILVLLMLMPLELRFATLFAVGIIFPCVSAVAAMGAAVGESLKELQQHADKRVVALREVMFGVRVVKCYGWEVAMQKKIAALRSREVTALKCYWNCTGSLICIFMAFPRLMIVATLGGYALMYGAHDVATIFTSLQMLACLRGSCELFAGTLARVAVIAPSVGRIQAFLKLPEAPSLKTGGKEWLQLASEASSKAVSIQGTFRWSSDTAVPPALRDIDVCIPAGELVAIVGAVGTGKSALLQALLGELLPEETSAASVSRPKIVAYSPQVPHIAEGTLRENVLFGQALDLSRYELALEAASLADDLKVLPGGDQVTIGARGVSLSGGQKARVSMARAAYHMSSSLVLLDDPFGSVDAPTAKTILEKLLLGSMRGRTCLVAMQPDSERLRSFSRVLLLSEGKVLAQGKPEDVMATEAYKLLLSRKEGESFEADRSIGSESPGKAQQRQPESQAEVRLREEEFEGRPSLALVLDYCQIGRYRHLLTAAVLLCLMIYIFLLCDLVLAKWTNELSINPEASARPYLSAYFFYMALALTSFQLGWRQGERFTLRLSSNILNMAVHSMLRAPIDRFFDKQPVGRIMSRLVGDLSSVDLTLYAKTIQTLVVIYATFMPLIYVHTMLPAAVTVLSLPMYYLLVSIYVRYRNTSVPMRYCYTSAKSDMNGLVNDMMASTAVLRAYGEDSRLSREMCMHVDRTLKVSMMSKYILKRWVGNRVQYLWSFMTSITYLVALVHPESVGAGTLGVCLTNLLLMQTLIESNIDSVIGSLFEIIALARINEYMNVPQEKPLKCPKDAPYLNFSARIPRNATEDCEVAAEKKDIRVMRGGKLLLQSIKDGKALVAPAFFEESGLKLKELCTSSSELWQAQAWHRIVGVNDVVGDAKAMAEELCKSRSAELVLDVRSGWLADGAKVELENVTAGYADIPRDVLKNISLSFEARTRVGIAGTTGCGKSSLLLVLLRILEPRAGRVMINGVHTSTLGLATLRSSLGLVPQDPVLFTGTIRHNLDPLNQYTDGRIEQALRCAHLEETMKSLSGGLDFQVADEGSNLSFGQRQLFCLARMVLRQPALLLLDEATSAIDPRSQENVQGTLNSAFPDSTLIAIAHRLETILQFDHVAVLEAGVVAEQGSVKELSQLKDGLFRKMLSAKKVW